MAAIARQAAEGGAPQAPEVSGSQLPQQGLITKLLNMYRGGGPSAQSTAGSLANREPYLQYVQQMQANNQQPLPFAAWAAQQQ